MGYKLDLPARLKELGVEIYSAAKKEYEAIVTGAGKQLKKEKLRKRFNLENPFKFVLLDNNIRIKVLDGFLARHAKRYDEDDIFVFFGNNKDNNFKKSQRIKDLSDNSIYEIQEIVEVQMPVSLDDKSIDVPCTAVYGKVL